MIQRETRKSTIGVYRKEVFIFNSDVENNLQLGKFYEDCKKVITLLALDPPLDKNRTFDSVNSLIWIYFAIIVQIPQPPPNTKKNSSIDIPMKSPRLFINNIYDDIFQNLHAHNLKRYKITN